MPAPRLEPGPRTVVFVLPPQLHLLDLAGPAQVFSTADDQGAQYRSVYVADTPDIATHQGLTVAASTTWPALSSRDVVIVPGWRTGAAPVHVPLSARLLDAVVAHHAAGGRVVGICVGAFALARAGLLDRRRATTHHDVQGELAQRFPATDVVQDVLFVKHDRVITSAGVASGIDLALHLVAGDHGPALAAGTARAMVAHARRAGSAPQTSVLLRHRDHLDDTVHRTQDLLDARFRQPLPLAVLAQAAGTSQRTLTRLFTSATGTTPLRYQQALRLEEAGHLTDQGWTREAAARHVGFTDARMLRRLTHPSPSGAARSPRPDEAPRPSPATAPRRGGAWTSS